MENNTTEKDLLQEKKRLITPAAPESVRDIAHLIRVKPRYLGPGRWTRVIRKSLKKNLK